MKTWHKTSSVIYILYAFIMPILVLCLYINKEDAIITASIELILFLALGIITIMTLTSYLCSSNNPSQKETHAHKEFQLNIQSKIHDDYTTCKDIALVLANISNQKHCVSISLESYLCELLYNIPDTLKIDHTNYDKLLNILIAEKKENLNSPPSKEELNTPKNKGGNNHKFGIFLENKSTNYIGIIVGLIGAIMSIVIRLS